MHSMLKDYLRLHFIVLLWGFTAILGKLISVPPVELVGAVDRATGALVRMLKANKVLSSEADGELETAVEMYLRDLGLGGA